jgi:predicted alpha/beta superfamily hydrolase
LVKTLKPFIDKKYRTQKDRSGTMIAGSSMGGLISYYAMLAYPDVFGKAGIFSPSFWVAPSIKAYTDSASGKVNGKLFFYMGGLEGAENLEHMYDVMQHLGTHSSALMYSVTDPGGRHNEAAGANGSRNSINL